MPQSLLVCGFHRSGTSMTMQLLMRAGVYAGHSLIGANPSNPDGHFEDIETVELHDRWLSEIGSNWYHIGPKPAIQKNIAAHCIEKIAKRLTEEAAYTGQPWAVKDPRATLFLPYWLDIMPELKIVAVYRHFSQCLHSLQRRQAAQLLQHPSVAETDITFWKTPEIALSSWLAHNRMIIESIRKSPDRFILVSQEALIDGAQLTSVINTRWKWTLDTQAQTGVDASKTQYTLKTDVPETPLRVDLESTWQEMQHMAHYPAARSFQIHWRNCKSPDSNSEHLKRSRLCQLWDQLGLTSEAAS